MKKAKLLYVFVLCLVFLLCVTQVYAEYKGPRVEDRRYSYICGYDDCNCSTSGCGGEDSGDGATHTDEGSGVSCQGNSPQVFCEKCPRWCQANYPDATIQLVATCSTGFGYDNWCRGDITVVAVGLDEQFKITGFENSDGTYKAAGGGSTESVAFTFSGEQMRTVEFWAHSGLGDTSEKATYEVKIDLTDPVNDVSISGTLSAQNWYKGPVLITSTAYDTFLSQTWVNAGWGQSLNSYTVPNTYSGSVIPKVRSVDLAGNDTGWEEFATIYVDNEIPTIKNYYNPNGKWFNTPIPLYVLSDDNYSGILSGYIFVDGQDIGARGNASSSSYTPSSQGRHTVAYQAEDRANNKSAMTSTFEFGYDVTPPVVKLVSNQSFDIVGPSITVSGTVTDNLSGAESVEIRYGTSGNWIRVTGQPASGTTNGTWSHTMNRDTAEGNNIFYVRATDIAGNISSGTNLTFTLNHDYTPPTVSMHTEGTKGEGGSYRGAVTFIGEAEDSVAGVKSIFVDLGLGAGEKPNSATTPAGYTGTVTACIRAVDNVDNSSECVRQEGVLVDNTKPTVSRIDSIDTSKVFTPDKTFSVTGADAHSGMYSVTISIDGTPFEALGNSNSVELGELGDGTHVVTVVLKDNAGNVLTSADNSALMISGIVTDGTSPSATITRPSGDSFVKDSLDFAGNITDNIGVNKAVVKIDGTVVKEYGPYNGTSANITDTLDTSGLGEGYHTVEFIAYDKAGNVSETYTSTFYVDRTAPSVSVRSEGIKGEGGVYRGAVTFIGEAEDASSGVKEIYVNAGGGEKLNSATTNASFSGNVNICVRAIDMVGNDSGCITQESVLVDNEKPRPVSYTNVSSKVVFVDGDTFDVTGTDTHSGMYSVTIILDGTPQEAQSGDSGSLNLGSIGDGTHTIEFLLTDNAGNVYKSADDPSVDTGTIVIDTTSPEVSVNKPSAGDYAKDSVSVEGTVTDNIGVSKVVISVDGTVAKEIPMSGTSSGFSAEIDTSSLSEGEHTITIQAFDQGNNASDPEVVTIFIDRTAPTVSFRTEGDKGEGGVYRGVVTFIGEADDSGAGVDLIYVDLGNGEKPNSNSTEEGFTGYATACIRAVDKVGNDSGCIEQESILIDNEKPFPVSYTNVSSKPVFTADDTFDVSGEDTHSGMYSVTVVLDGEPVSEKQGSSNSIPLADLPDGEHSIEFLLTDNAGNVYNSADDPSVDTGTIVIDKTGPELTVDKPTEAEYVGDTLNIAGSAADNIGLGKVVISIDGAEVAEVPLSGTEDEFDVDISISTLPEGEHTITVQAFDQGDNPSNIEERTIIVDHTAPECHIEVYGERGDGGNFRGEVRLVAVCTDGGSGVDKSYVNNGEGRVENEIVIPSDHTGEVDPKVAGIDKTGNDSGDVDAQLIYMPDGTVLDRIFIDNNAPYVTEFFTPSSRWLRVDYLDMFVEGEDAEGPLYSGTIIVNGKEYTVRSEDDRSDLHYEIDEGISTLEYYVTDLSGNTSDIVDRVRPGEIN
ncbi:MAG: Ig-like domain repeat protein [Anaerolineaceae bacterium]|nr:Ig-like domain repeat protein [Anaerolineaceae bacterium]